MDQVRAVGRHGHGSTLYVLMMVVGGTYEGVLPHWERTERPKGAGREGGWGEKGGFRLVIVSNLYSIPVHTEYTKHGNGLYTPPPPPTTHHFVSSANFGFRDPDWILQKRFFFSKLKKKPNLLILPLRLRLRLRPPSAHFGSSAVRMREENGDFSLGKGGAFWMKSTEGLVARI